MGAWVWILEGFDRESGGFRERHELPELSDLDAMHLLGSEELGDGDLYEISEDSLVRLSLRFGLKVFPKHLEYLLGREASPSSLA